MPVFILNPLNGASLTGSMPKLIGGLAALTALAAGVFAKVDPVACLERAGRAFMVGVFGTQLWNGLFTSPVGHVKTKKGPESEPAQAD